MNKLPSKHLRKPLAVVLSTAASPGELSTAIATVSWERMERELEQRLELEGKLLELRRSWKRVPEHRATIEAKADQVKQQLQQIPKRLTLRQAHSEDPGRIIDDLILLFCWVNDQVNISATLNELQMESAAHLLIETYPSLRLEDVAIALRNGISGQYGSIYNRIDPALLLEWVGHQAETIRDHRTEKNYARHLSSKEDATARRGSATLRTILKDL